MPRPSGTGAAANTRTPTRDSVARARGRGPPNPCPQPAYRVDIASLELEPVADAGLGHDQARCAGVSLQLLSEVSDEYAQTADSIFVAVAEHSPEKLAVC